VTRKKPTTSKDDTDLFLEMMEGVKPLPQNKIDPDSAPKKARQKRIQSTQKNPSAFGESEYTPPVAADAVLSFTRGGVQQKILSKLKKGQFPIERKIDLHGSNINEAGAKLQQAIEEAINSQQRCVLVIHGRGKGSFDNKPAIKTHVNQWLRNSIDVLAFCSALPKDGGTGAVYILLKRRREY